LVPVNYASTNGNQMMNSVFNFSQVNTLTAIGSLDAPYAATPTPALNAWVKRLVKTFNAGDLFYGYSGNQVVSSATSQVEVYSLRTSGSVTSFPFSAYYKLAFSTPNDTFDSIIVYRRVFNAVAAAGAGTNKYLGLGPWEKVVIPRASMTKTSGLYTVNLRGPIHPDIFNPYGSATTPLAAGAFHSMYGSSGKYPNSWSGTNFVADAFPYWGVGNGPTSSGSYVEFLLAIKDAGVESAKAARLTDFSSSNAVGDYSGFGTGGVRKDSVVTLADYNVYDAGYKRNLNEALTNSSGGNIAHSKLVVPGTSGANMYAGNGPIYKNAATDVPANWKVVTNPENGDTVY
jgi:hypothetical protein